MEDLRIDWNQFIKWFNATLEHYKSAIPPIVYITPGKRRQAQRLVNDTGTKKVLIDAVVHMAQSDFCNGRKKTKLYPSGWLASFPWLLSSDEIIFDLANGKYDNAPDIDLTPEEKRQQEMAEREAAREQQRLLNQQLYEAEQQRQREAREAMFRDAAKGEELKRIFADMDKKLGLRSNK